MILAFVELLTKLLFKISSWFYCFLSTYSQAIHILSTPISQHILTFPPFLWLFSGFVSVSLDKKRKDTALILEKDTGFFLHFRIIKYFSFGTCF